MTRRCLFNYSWDCVFLSNEKTLRLSIPNSMCWLAVTQPVQRQQNKPKQLSGAYICFWWRVQTAVHFYLFYFFMKLSEPPPPPLRTTPTFFLYLWWKTNQCGNGVSWPFNHNPPPPQTPSSHLHTGIYSPRWTKDPRSSPTPGLDVNYSRGRTPLHELPRFSTRPVKRW